MAKTKLKESLRRAFPNCVLFREDLEEIYAALEREGKSPEAKCGGYSFDAIEDLCEHLGSRGTHALKIESEHPWISVDTYYDGKVVAALSASSQTDVGLASYHIVSTILERTALKKGPFGTNGGK